MPFEIPTSWQWVSVEDISTSILYGVSESAKENGQYKLLRITDIQNNNVCWDTVPFTNYDKDVSNYLLEKGDILFARTGATVGKSFLIEEQLNLKAIYASYLIRVRTASDICPEYLKYFFESGYYWSQITSSSVGVGQPNVNGTSLGCLNLPLPPFKEQKRIVSTLRDYFKGAENIEKAIHSLNGNISLLKSKVLELAVTGKLVPQNPDDEPAAELLRRINPEAQIVTDNGHYKNLPSGWFVTKLPDICSKIVDGDHNPPKSQDLPTPYAMLSASNIDKDKIINLTNVRYLSKKDYDESNKRTLLQKGDLLLTTVGSIGRSCILMDNRNYALQRSVTVISSPLNVNYLKIFIDSPITQRFLKENARGTAQKGFYLNQFDNLEIPIPPQEEQKRIVSKIQEFYPLLSSIKEALQV